MPEHTQEQLRDALAHTLEELCFLYEMPELEVEQEETDLPANASVTFHGPFEGALEVRMATGLLPVVAANMLGTTDLPTEADQLDALGEVANVVCGNVLPALGGATAVFDIGAPAKALSGGATPSEAPRLRVRLNLENGPAEARLYLPTAVAL